MRSAAGVRDGTGGACPSAADLVAFVEGGLGGAARASVAAHIDDCDECAVAVTDCMGSPATLASAAVPPAEGILDQEPLPRGLTLGRYIVVDMLGAGGIGEVYSAYDPDLDRQVAVKVVRRGVLGERDYARWEGRARREARALAKLSHPNVVPIHDVGVIDGRFFIAMERVDGVTLGRWVRQRSRPWQDVKAVLAEAGRGLAAAHRAGLVHRDFKPGNVMVGKDGRVRVLDFGLVRQAHDADEPQSGHPTLVVHHSADPLLTRTGTVLGTPAYMAPEQLCGAAADARTDQFAFCLTAYECLCGRRPFADDTASNRARAIQSGAFADGDHKIPTWLRSVLRRGLSARPEDRFESMDELLAALTADRRRRWRAWGLAAASTLAAASLIADLALREAPGHDGSPEHVEMLALASEARDAAAQAYFVYPPRDDPQAPTAFVKVLELEANTSDPHGPDIAAELRAEFAETLRRLGDQYWSLDGGAPFATDYYAGALLFDPDDEHSASRVHLTPVQLEDLRHRAAERDYSTGELGAAALLAALAEEDEDKKIERVAALYANADVPSLAFAAALERALGDRASRVFGTRQAPPRARVRKREEVVPHAPAVEPRAPPETPAAPVPGARRTLAAAEEAARSGQLKKAEELFHRGLRLSPNNGRALHGLAKLFYERGRYAKSLAFAARAAKASPSRSDYHRLHGDALFKLLRYRDAEKAYERALRLGDTKAKARLARVRRKVGEG